MNETFIYLAATYQLAQANKKAQQRHSNCAKNVMRFITKAQEYEALKADNLEKLAQYIEAVKNTTYEDLKDKAKSLSLLKAYSAAVESNAAFRSFLYKDKQIDILTDDME